MGGGAGTGPASGEGEDGLRRWRKCLELSEASGLRGTRAEVRTAPESFSLSGRRRRAAERGALLALRGRRQSAGCARREAFLHLEANGLFGTRAEGRTAFRVWVCSAVGVSERQGVVPFWPSGAPARVREARARRRLRTWR